jgi:hypothetical protein
MILSTATPFQSNGRFNMKRFLLAGCLALLAAPVLAANVGVSINVGEPGFYGQIDIGNYPRPEVIYQQPVVIQRAPAYMEPIYLRVPPGYAKHWSRHCRAYNACGKPVYFVRSNWYNDVYAPRYREEHRHEYRDERRDERRDEHRDDRRDDRQYDRRDGPQHGDGHGNPHDRR